MHTAISVQHEALREEAEWYDINFTAENTKDVLGILGNIDHLVLTEILLIREEPKHVWLQEMFQLVVQLLGILVLLFPHHFWQKVSLPHLAWKVANAFMYHSPDELFICTFLFCNDMHWLTRIIVDGFHQQIPVFWWCQFVDDGFSFLLLLRSWILNLPMPFWPFPPAFNWSWRSLIFPSDIDFKEESMPFLKIRGGGCQNFPHKAKMVLFLRRQWK